MSLCLLELPLEIQEYILRLVYLASRKEPDYMSVIFQDADGVERSARTAIDMKPEDMDWEPSLELQCRTTLFPFNAASVCRLWSSILARSSEYWTRILFDVAIDPTPLLDAFLWSKSLPISVCVFNGSYHDGTPSSPQGSSQEKIRAAKIAEKLSPHIYRCNSIVFDLIYGSSLPPPDIVFTEEVPFLETFKLDCAIDDLDCNWHHALDESMMNDSFPSLRTISFTGPAFMSLSPTWISTLQCGETVSLSISHLALKMASKDCDRGNTFSKFMDLIKISCLRDLHFKSITLSLGRPEYPPRLMIHQPHFLSTIESIHFDSVSESFIRLLSNTVQFSTLISTTRFSNCVIPRIEYTQWNRSNLTLDNIICPAEIEDSDRPPHCSLRNAVSAWKGGAITFSSCPGFDDSFLHWFCEAKSLDNVFQITIEDCPNFTAEGIRTLIAHHGAYDEDNHKLSLRIIGNVPSLREEDLTWIQEMDNLCEVEWAVVDRNNVVITTDPLAHSIPPPVNSDTVPVPSRYSSSSTSCSSHSIAA